MNFGSKGQIVMIHAYFYHWPFLNSSGGLRSMLTPFLLIFLSSLIHFCGYDNIKPKFELYKKIQTTLDNGQLLSVKLC